MNDLNKRVTRAWSKKLISVCIGVVLSLCLIEGLLIFFFAFPFLLRFAPKQVVLLLRQPYLDTRNITQNEEQGGRYDPRLFYTLKPGAFVFSNAEFRTVFQVNSIGLRDSEAALHAPQIIVLGDSIAMGWGVDQDKTFPRLIENRTGLKVLNAGIASYGTVREMMLLDQLDTSQLKYLIIQYCDNDVAENEPYFKNQFKIDSELFYRDAVAEYKKSKRYYFGRYSLILFSVAAHGFINKIIRRNIFAHDKPAFQYDPEYDARIFLNAFLRAGHKDLKGVKVILFEVNSYGKNSSGFSLAVSKQSRANQNLEVLDASKVLDAEKDYYVLDDHLNERGHQKVAGMILRQSSLNAYVRRLPVIAHLREEAGRK